MFVRPPRKAGMQRDSRVKTFLSPFARSGLPLAIYDDDANGGEEKTKESTIARAHRDAIGDASERERLSSLCPSVPTSDKQCVKQLTLQRTRNFDEPMGITSTSLGGFCGAARGEEKKITYNISVIVVVPRARCGSKFPATGD